MVTERQTQKNIIVIVGVIMVLIIGLLSCFSIETPTVVTFSVQDKWINEPVDLTIAAYHNSNIYFTIDGSIPTSEHGIKYNEPLSLTAQGAKVLIIRARAYGKEGVAGPVTTKTYFINMDFIDLPIMSIAISPEDFYGVDNGIYLNPQQRGRASERIANISYVSSDRASGFDIPVGIRIHGGITRGMSKKKSYRFYFRKEYGASRLLFPLFSEEGSEQFDQLVLHNSGKDLNLFRNALVDRLMRQMGGYASRSQPALLFINGELQGIYMLRERISMQFFSNNYNFKNAVVVNTPSLYEGEPHVASWENLISYVKENDLSQAHHYNYVATQIDINNFIDYYLINLYSANLDWTYVNIHQFHEEGGVWKWATWDSDLTFSSPNIDAINRARTFDDPSAEDMVAFFDALLKNDSFRQKFENRANELFATVLSPENVLREIQLLSDVLAVDIPLEKNRWSIEHEWDQVIEEMNKFATLRPTIMLSNIANSLAEFRED